MTEMNFGSMTNAEYDNALNDISKELFTMDKDLDNDRVRLMQWGLINLLKIRESLLKKKLLLLLKKPLCFLSY